MVLRLSDPIDDGVVADPCGTLDRSETETIEIKNETMLLDIGWIAFRLVSIEELTRALTAQVILPLLTATVLNDVSRLAVWTLHWTTLNAASYYYCATPTYLYGIVEPKTGESFFFEFSHLNTDCFQMFLNLVSEQFKDDLLIIQLDNGAFHKAKRLQMPSNIIVIFQPPYCPELNPIEQVWQYLKRRLRWSLAATLDQLRQQLRERLASLTPQSVVSITGRQSILDALSVAGI